MDATSEQAPRRFGVVRGPELVGIENVSLGRHFLQCLDRHKDMIAQIDPARMRYVSYVQLKLFSIRVAEEMRRRSVGHGDVISVCSGNNSEVYLTILAAFYVGTVIVPIDPLLSKPDTKHILSVTKPKMIFCDDASLDKVSSCRVELDADVDVVVFGERGPRAKRATAFDEFVSYECGDSFNVIDFEDPSEQIAFLMPTSGATGPPKIVALTHRNVVCAVRSALWRIDFPGTVTMSLFGVGSIAGMVFFLACIDRGMKRIVATHDDTELVLRYVQKYQVHWLAMGVSAALATVYHPSAPSFDLECVSNVVVCGDRISDRQLMAAKTLFNRARVSIGYVSTEMCGPCFTIIQKNRSCGYLNPGLECKVVHAETGHELGPYEHGELHFRGATTMKGYFHDPALSGDALDAHGWYRSGDLGYYDENECFYVLRRLDDAFLFRDIQIYPSELEDIVNKIPGVQQGVVVGVPHSDDGFRTTAFVVRQAHSKRIGNEDIIRVMAASAETYKQLYGGVIFLDSFPQTPNGAVHRRELIKLAS